MPSIEPELLRKRPMAGKNARYRCSTSTMTTTTNNTPEIDSYSSLITSIFELFLITILYALQYILIFILQRVEGIIASFNYSSYDGRCKSMTNGNRLWRRLCRRGHSHDDAKIQSCLTDYRSYPKNSDGITQWLRTQTSQANFHDKCLLTSIDDWTTKTKNRTKKVGKVGKVEKVGKVGKVGKAGRLSPLLFWHYYDIYEKRLQSHKRRKEKQTQAQLSQHPRIYRTILKQQSLLKLWLLPTPTAPVNPILHLHLLPTFTFLI